MGDDISIQVIQVSYSQTKVIVEASMHIGAAKFAGINMEAWGNKNNAQKVMDRIIANLKRL